MEDLSRRVTLHDSRDSCKDYTSPQSSISTKSRYSCCFNILCHLTVKYLELLRIDKGSRGSALHCSTLHKNALSYGNTLYTPRKV